MANKRLKSMLNASKEADRIVKEGENHLNRSTNPLGGRITAKNYDTKMAELDNLVFGPYDKTLNENRGSSYSAEAEMKLINERKNGKNPNINSKIPQKILEDIIANPYDFDTNIITSDPRMTQLEERIMSTNKQITNGIDKVLQINKDLETLDETTTQQPTEQQHNTPIDYSLIKTIVESVVDEKLSKGLLNESLQPRTISAIMLGENFKFIDSEGNLYECGELKYKGKAKMKNKR